jgi:hypothetical protein
MINHIHRVKKERFSTALRGSGISGYYHRWALYQSSISVFVVFCVPVTPLELSLKLITTSVNDIEIIVRQLAPLLLDLAFNQQPVSFHSIPVQR